MRRTPAFSRSSRPERRPRRGRSVDLERYRSIIDPWSRFVEASSRPEPTVLRVRTGRIGPDDLVSRLEEQGYRLRPLEGLPAFFEVQEGPRPVSFTLEHWLGLIYVQQASTGVAAPAWGPRPGERVLDLCSAPGGKATHAADLMEDRGTVVASEINEGRIRGLLGNVYRMGHPNMLVVSADGRDVPEDALFDRVLVDAPCSGEGTLRRRGGQPPNQSASFLAYVTRVQEALLRKAIRVTRPGGTVLYVTCTFAPEENEAVVSRVLEDEPVEVLLADLPVPHARGLTRFQGRRFDPRMEQAARIYPHHLDSGGLFLVRLRKLDDGGSAPAPSWRAVPLVYPGDGMARGRARDLVHQGRAYLEDHFGVARELLESVQWMARGGRLWMHRCGEWPVEAWTPGGWRAVSVGFRALAFDSFGRPRPTNDLLRWLDRRITRGVVDVGDDHVLRLARGEPLPWPDELRGLLALRLRGAVIGRAVPTTAGIRGQIPRSRARDLEGVLEASTTEGARPGDA